MRDESYSFIWHPWVLMYSFLLTGFRSCRFDLFKRAGEYTPSRRKNRLPADDFALAANGPVGRACRSTWSSVRCAKRPRDADGCYRQPYLQTLGKSRESALCASVTGLLHIPVACGVFTLVSCVVGGTIADLRKQGLSLF